MVRRKLEESAKKTEIALDDWRLGIKRRLSVRKDFPAEQVRNPGAQPVVLLPGIWERWSATWLWALKLHEAGFNVLFVPELDLELGSIDILSTRLSEWITENVTTPPIVVAHSKGGLVAKSALVRSPGAIKGLIACGTPFEGAPIAKVAPFSLRVRNLRPESPEIRELATHTSENARIIAIQAQWDQNVPTLDELPGGKLLEAPVTGHNHLLEDPDTAELIAEAARWIDENWE